MLFGSGDFKRMKFATVTANGTTPVNVTVKGLQADSFYDIKVNTVSGTIGAFLLTGKTPATSSNSNGTIQFTSTAGNTSVYDLYILI